MIHADFWDGEAVIEVGTLPGDSDSMAFDLNDDGTVVRLSLVPSGAFDLAGNELRTSHAVVWVDGVCVDLNARIGPVLGTVLDTAMAIDGEGQIAVLGQVPGSEQANIHLLTPAL